MDVENYFCFRIDGIRLGLPLHYIDRVIRAVAVNMLPNPPQIVHGLIDYHGSLVAVVNLRRRLGLPEHPISSDQVFVMVNTQARKLALVADMAEGIVPLLPEESVSPRSIDAGLEVAGLCRTGDGVLLIYDPEQFLSSGEAIQLDEAIQLVQTGKTAQ